MPAGHTSRTSGEAGNSNAKGALSKKFPLISVSISPRMKSVTAFTSSLFSSVLVYMSVSSCSLLKVLLQQELWLMVRAWFNQ